MDAFEDDELRFGVRGRLLGELEGISGDVRELDDLVTLVVVAQEEDPVSQRGLGRGGPSHEVGIGRRRQVTGTLHAALRVGVRSMAQQQQGQRGSLWLVEGHAPSLTAPGNSAARAVLAASSGM